MLYVLQVTEHNGCYPTGNYHNLDGGTTSDIELAIKYDESSSIYRNWISPDPQYNSWRLVPYYDLDLTSKTPYFDFYEQMRK